MESLIDKIMEESEVKSRFSGNDTSSISSLDDENMLSLLDMISSKRINLLEIVVALEKYHTSGNVEQRTKSINILESAIHEVEDLRLDSKASTALAQFFCKKLKDVHSVLPAVKSIYAILKYHPLAVKDSQRKGDG